MKMDVDNLAQREKLEQADKLLSIGDISYLDSAAVFSTFETGNIRAILSVPLNAGISEEDIAQKNPQELAEFVREELAYQCQYIADRIRSNGDYGKEVEIRKERLKRDRAACKT